MTELNENSSLKNRIPDRGEVPVENTWRLEDIFPTDEDWERLLLRSRSICHGLRASRAGLCRTAGRSTSF